MIKLDVKTSKNDELRRKTFKTTQNYEIAQITMNCIHLTSKRSKMLTYVANHSKSLNYKSDQIGRQNDLKCWVTSQNIQNNAKLQKWSKNNDLHRFDVKTIKATQNSKRDQIPMNLHRFEVLMIKNVELRRKPFKTAKLQKWSNWTSKRAKMLSYVANHSKPLNYKSDQITMNCIDLTSKRSKMLSYVANHSKQRQTTKVIKKQWLASIWCQNDQRNAKLWKWSNYNELHRFDVQTIKNVELRRRTFKTAKLQKWSNWTSKRTKMLSYVANHSKPLNYKSDQIGRQNDLKC